MVKISASRRDILGGAAAAVAAPAVAAQSSGPSATPVNTMQDPTGRYPKPPFPRQPQPWPGLASKMQPLPDHGEKSYRGSGRLMGRKALITGGDSGIGRAAAIAYAREGADVAINYLPAEESDAREVVALIRAEGRKAVAIPGDIRDPAFCRKLVANAVRELGGLDILVNNAGRQQSVDNLAELDDAAFDWTMKTNIYAPFWITKAALPHLKPGSAIIITASVQAFQPSGNLFDYAQTKAANVAFAKSRAQQLGHPRERCGPRPLLDAAAALGWAAGRCRRQLRREHAAGAARPAGRTGRHLCHAGRARAELCHRPGLWRIGRNRGRLTHLRTLFPPVFARCP